MEIFDFLQKRREEKELKLKQEQFEINLENFIKEVKYAERMIWEYQDDFDFKKFRETLIDQYKEYLDDKNFIQAALDKDAYTFKYINLSKLFETDVDFHMRSVDKTYGIDYTLEVIQKANLKKELIEHILETYEGNELSYLSTRVNGLVKEILETKSNDEELIKAVIWDNAYSIDKDNEIVKKYLQDEKFVLSMFEKGLEKDRMNIGYYKASNLIKLVDDSLFKDKSFVEDFQEVINQTKIPNMQRVFDEKLKELNIENKNNIEL